MPGCQRHPEKHKQPQCLTQQGRIFLKQHRLPIFAARGWQINFPWHNKSSPHTQWKNKTKSLHQNAHWLSWVYELRAAHLARVRVDAIRLQHLSLLEEIELRCFRSLTSVKKEQSWSSFFPPINTKIIRMAPMRSQRHADWGKQMTSDWLLTLSEDRKPGSDGDISCRSRSCVEVVQPRFLWSSAGTSGQTLVPTPAYLLWRDTDAVQIFWAFEIFKSSDYASLDTFFKSKIWIENHYIFYE